MTGESKRVNGMERGAVLFAFLIGLSLLGVAVGQEFKWGGQVNGQGSAIIFEAEGDDRESVYDGTLDLRLKGDLLFSDRVSMTAHYEAGSVFSDERPSGVDSINGSSLQTGIRGRGLSDERRLFDFTRTISRNDHALIYHRLDRLFISWESDGGSMRCGRQALTWGNGLVFNPMDILNPFAPTDIIRDYKMGNDMLVFQGFSEDITDLQLVWVPGRNPVTGNIDGSSASVAGKVIYNVGEKSVELMLARHYRDYVAGAGLNGELGDAAWRTDVTWTRLDDGERRSSYFSTVANMDYSFTVAGHNWYGLIEVYHNGLGGDDFVDVLSDPAVSERISRGELFITGELYLAGELRFEAHPLVNFYLSTIYNTEYASMVLQPRIVWDAAESVRIIAGGDLPAGGDDTEFGGIHTQGGSGQAAPQSFYLRGTWFF